MTAPLRHYCTVFDRHYAVKGIALHESLTRHAAPFRLYALCMDDDAHSLLEKLGRPDLVPLRLEHVVPASDLADMRARMSHAQVCWTCQPYVCLYVLKAYAPLLVTYLEADSYFFASPEPLFAELGANAVSLVAHRFAPQVVDQTGISGRYCVQFNAFADDPDGHAALQDWAAECRKYSRDSPSYLPGQLALDDWPQRFPRVVELTHPGAGVAPWNVQQYRVSRGPSVNGRPVIFFHFHELAAVRDGGYFLSSYPLPLRAVHAFYRPYLHALERAESAARNADSAFDYRRWAPDGARSYSPWAYLATRLRGKLAAAVRRVRALVRGTASSRARRSKSS